MTLADDNLAIGRELLSLDPRGRPRQITLRKAIHCAYYAAFTALGEEWVATFDPMAQPLAARTLDHGRVKGACDAIRGKGMVSSGVPCPPELLTVARLIPTLRRQRHEADYNPNARFTRSVVEDGLDDADQVIQHLRAARTNHRGELHLFLLRCTGAQERN